MSRPQDFDLEHIPDPSPVVWSLSVLLAAGIVAASLLIITGAMVALFVSVYRQIPVAVAPAAMAPVSVPATVAPPSPTPNSTATATAPPAIPLLVPLPVPALATPQPSPQPSPTPVPEVPTSTPPPPTATPGSLQIVTVDKPAEFVEIQNQTAAPVDLAGWYLLSERGAQKCALSGIIQPGEILRIWAMTGSSGYNCQFGSEIWNNQEYDPAILYNPADVEISRRE